MLDVGTAVGTGDAVAITTGVDVALLAEHAATDSDNALRPIADNATARKWNKLIWILSGRVEKMDEACANQKAPTQTTWAALYDKGRKVLAWHTIFQNLRQPENRAREPQKFRNAKKGAYPARYSAAPRCRSARYARLVRSIVIGVIET